MLRTTLAASAIPTVLVWAAACMPVGGPWPSGSGGSGGSTGSTSTNLSGKVVDSKGQPVGNAKVSWPAAPPSGGSQGNQSFDPNTGKISTTTDASGNYSLDGEPLGGGDHTVDVDAPGHAPQFTVLPNKPGIIGFKANVVLWAAQETAITPGQPTQVNPGVLGGQAEVTITGISQAGFKARWAAIDAAVSPPGVLRDAAEGSDKMLQSAGMFYLSVVDGNGNPAAFGGGGAAVKVQMPASNPPKIPDAEPFAAYRLDEKQGKWVKKGQLPDPSQPASFDPDSFGFWNSDRNFRTACVIAKLQASTGACAGARVQATGPDGISSYDTSEADGKFCVVGAQTWGSTLNVGGTSQKIQMPSNAGDCSKPASCQDIGNVSTSDDACGKAGGQAGKCNSQQVAGADTPETRQIDMNKACGSFDFSWNMYSQKDQMTVTYEGQTLLDTGCVSGGGQKTLQFCGQSTQVTVQVTPNCAGGKGTAWNFSASCPTDGTKN